MTRSGFVLAPEARTDLLEIWNYIAEDSFERADRVLARLHQTFIKLAERPGMGHRRPDLVDDRYRFWRVYSCLVVYREAIPLEVIAVVHGARHLDAFLRNRTADASED